MKSDFLIALTQLAAERHLPKEEVLKAIEAALASAFKKDNWGETTSVSLGEPISAVEISGLGVFSAEEITNCCLGHRVHWKPTYSTLFKIIIGFAGIISLFRLLSTYKDYRNARGFRE